MRFLIVQTAFLGDVVLTLPVLQVLKRMRPDSQLDLMVVPNARDIVANHPDVSGVLVYDKRGSDAGISGFLRTVREVRRRRYGTALVPHRSFRSAALVRLSGIPERIGFDASAGRVLLTRTVPFDRSRHEIERNLRLLEPLGLARTAREQPRLAGGEAERRRVDALLEESGVSRSLPLAGIAPGTVWNTKRWPEERYSRLCGELTRRGVQLALVGGAGDADLCRRVAAGAGARGVVVAAGRLTLPESAELIRRCGVLVCNDSAPMHLAGGVGVPVVSVFGATVPEFGFAPSGPRDVIVETRGLSCRPCSSHGGDRCPIGTFECMISIPVERVLEHALELLSPSTESR